MESFIPPSSAKEHARYLEEQVERYSKAIKQIEDEIRKLESQKIEAHSSLVYFGGMLEFIKGQNQTCEVKAKQVESFSSSSELQSNLSQQALNHEIDLEIQLDESSELNPLDMLKPEFRNKSMDDVVIRALDVAGGRGTALTLARIAYDAPDEKNFSRARNSISSALREGAVAGKGWQKIGRGEFALDSYLANEHANNGGKSVDLNSFSGLIASEDGKDPQGIP